MNDLSTLYSELGSQLVRYAINFTKEIHSAEDIVSETFLRATQHCIVNKEVPARAWFYKVTRNISLDWIRKNSKLSYGDIPEKIDDSIYTNPDKAFQNMEESSSLYSLLYKIMEPYKSILILREYDELSYAEISEIMNITVDNVKVMLFRARQKLRKYYWRDCK